MDYVALAFPPRIAFGARSEPAWQTSLGRVQGGAEATNQDWEDNKHFFDVAPAVRDADDYAEVRAHFNVMRGRAKKFRFGDPLDFSATLEPALTTGVSNHYQLTKRYGESAGSDAYDRKITRPRSGVQVFRTRSGITTNITGSTTIGAETGEIVVTGHAGGDVYTWTGEFDVPCRYDVDRLPGTIINKRGRDLLVDVGSIPICEVAE